MSLLRSGRIAVVALAVAAGCAPSPFCGLPADATGRLVAYCDSPRDQPVCDEPGAQAHFEEGAMGLLLVGGRVPSCNSEDELVCPTGTAGEPYCITDPQL